jgi:2'-5' RNA ligase
VPVDRPECSCYVQSGFSPATVVGRNLAMPPIDLGTGLCQGVLWPEKSRHALIPGVDTARSWDTVFLALQPPPVVTQQISKLAWHLHDKHRLQGMPLRTRCFHISLLGIGRRGQLSSETMVAVSAAATSLSISPFRVCFDRAISFRGRANRPLVLVGDDGVDGIRVLRRELMTALHEIGFSTRGSLEFTPHITLLYDEQDVREQAVEEVGWTVRELVMLHSLHGRSQHVALARWALRG